MPNFLFAENLREHFFFVQNPSTGVCNIPSDSSRCGGRAASEKKGGR